MCLMFGMLIVNIIIFVPITYGCMIPADRDRQWHNQRNKDNFFLFPISMLL